MEEVMRVALLIDGENVRYSAKEANMRFDYRKLFEFVKQNYQVVYGGYYTIQHGNGEQTNNERQKQYLKHFSCVAKKILGLWFKIHAIQPKVYRNSITWRYTCPNCGYQGTEMKDKHDGDMDIYIATDAFRLAHTQQVDCILLVSCDQHFIPLVKLLSELGVRTAVIGDELKTPFGLRNTASRFYSLSQFLTPKNEKNSLTALASTSLVTTAVIPAISG